MKPETIRPLYEDVKAAIHSGNGMNADDIFRIIEKHKVSLDEVCQQALNTGDESLERNKLPGVIFQWVTVNGPHKCEDEGCQRLFSTGDPAIALVRNSELHHLKCAYCRGTLVKIEGVEENG